MKKILTLLLVIVAALCTAFAFGACDLNELFGTDNSASDNSSSSGDNTTGDNTPSGSNSSSGSNTPSGSNTSGGNSGTNSNQPHTCSYTFTSTVAADCLNKGYDLFSCTCGKTEKRNYKPALGHDYKYTTHNATCTTDWWQEWTCNGCGDYGSQQVADSKLSHDYQWTTTKDATCTVDGSKSGVCADCGDTTTEVIKSAGHSYGAYTSNNDATCAKDGTKSATCSACGAKDTQTVTGTMLQHSFGNYISNNDADCSHKGTKTATCSACGEKDTVMDEAAKGGSHDWKYSSTGGDNCQSQYISTKTCLVCGEKEVIYSGEYGNHSVSNGKCTLCGYTLPKTKGKYELVIYENSAASKDFDKVYLEFTVLGVSGYVMTYEMYIVQEYTVSGQKKTTSNKVILPNPDSKNCGFYEFKLWSVKDNAEATFSGWIDYDVDLAANWITFVIGGGSTDGTYTFGQRYWIAF